MNSICDFYFYTIFKGYTFKRKTTVFQFKKKYSKSTQVIPVGLEDGQGNVYFFKSLPSRPDDDQPGLSPTDRRGLLARSDQDTYITAPCRTAADCFCMPSDKRVYCRFHQRSMLGTLLVLL